MWPELVSIESGGGCANRTSEFSVWILSHGFAMKTLKEAEPALLALIRDLKALSSHEALRKGLNIFAVAGIGRQEIKHSNVLAFFLDPSERHGLGDRFLRNMLRRALEKLPTLSPLSPLEAELINLGGATVRREWKNIDLLILSEEAKIAFAIENKIEAVESEHQLQKYEKSLSDFPSYKSVCAYLTKDGSEASSQRWSPISYQDVVACLDDARSETNELDQESSIIIDHYMQFVRSSIVPDEKLIEACKKLYSQHRQAIQLVIEFGEINPFSQAVDSLFLEYSNLQRFGSSSSRASFLPSDMMRMLPEFPETEWWSQSRPLLFWFYLIGNRVGLVLEVGPLKDPKHNREAFAKDLFTLFGRTRRITPTFTRVYTAYEQLNESTQDDPAAIKEAMKKLYSSVMDSHHRQLIKVIEKHFK